MIHYIIIIPARYASTRLPGKPLADIGGKPMIQHVVENTKLTTAATVVVASDDERVKACVEGFGGVCVMTDANHTSGTDRIAEVVDKLLLDDQQIIVNIQGDEPDMPASLVEQISQGFNAAPDAKIVTACAPLDNSEQLHDPNCVKVVRDKDDSALYFSRAPIAFPRSNDGNHSARRHIGIYGYRAGTIREFSARAPCELEQTESLEQLRTLWHGEKIYCPDACATPGPGIDTPEDLALAREKLAKA
ncbi:MAG: 3-deoxy-manno-octulosonate cytidylyltransferase (CMP-KDO synthetase) [Saprospiraceae bacterium]|jgi:3-deoxy-manno-octulosonate cytidylyltransferase (CMP-KDO synthetase)